MNFQVHDDLGTICPYIWHRNRNSVIVAEEVTQSPIAHSGFLPWLPHYRRLAALSATGQTKGKAGKNLCKTLLIEEKGTYVQVFFKPEKLRYTYIYHKIYRKLKLSSSWSLPDLFSIPLETAVQALTIRESPKEHDLSAGISFKQSSSLSSGNWISISLGHRVVAGEKHPTKTWRPRKDAVRLSTGWRGQTCWPHLDATCWRKHNEILLTATSELQCND